MATATKTTTRPKAKPKIKLPVISVEYLQSVGACEGSIEQFIDVFGEKAKVRVTRESLRKFARHGFDVAWMAAALSLPLELRMQICEHARDIAVKMGAAEDGWWRKSSDVREHLRELAGGLMRQLAVVYRSADLGDDPGDVLRDLSAALADMTTVLPKLSRDQEKLHETWRKSLAKVHAHADKIADLIGLP